MRDGSFRQLFFDADTRLIVAAEQVVQEIGQHTSFQGIINNLYSGSLGCTSLALLTSLYSLAEYDQPNVYQSVVVLVDVLPVSPCICP